MKNHFNESASAFDAMFPGSLELLEQISKVTTKQLTGKPLKTIKYKKVKTSK